MLVHRIARTRYIEDLSGLGAKLHGGRWHKEGINIVYTSSHLSLCVLELLVNNLWAYVDRGYSYISLQIPKDILVHMVETTDLPGDWRAVGYHEYTIQAGSNWIQEKNSAALIVPSAVLTLEQNVLLNPNHPDFSKIKVVNKGTLALDQRLVKPY